MSFKKLICAITAVAMLICSMSFAAFADETEVTPGYEVRALTGDELNVTAIPAIGQGEENITLDFGRVFTATEEYDSSLASSDLYNYLADFEITFSHDVVAKLAGYYELAAGYTGGNWVAICTDGADEEFGDGIVSEDGFTFKANQPVRIMKYVDARFTYGDVLNFVKEFKCGVELAPGTPDGVEIDLSLCLYETEWSLDDENHKEFEEKTPYRLSSETFVYDNPAYDVTVGAKPEEIVEAVNNTVIDTEDAFENTVKFIAALPIEAKASVKPETVAALYDYKSVQFESVAKAYLLDIKEHKGIDVKVTPAASLFSLSMDMGDLYDVTATDANGNVDELAVPVLVKIPVSGDVAGVILKKADGTEVDVDYILENGFVTFSTASMGQVSVIAKTDAISVEFDEVTANEGEKLYNINLVAANAGIINRLLSADLTFELTSDNAMAYEIIPVAPVNVTPDKDGRYMFSFDGLTAADATASSITIAQVKLDGYSAFSFIVKDVATNVVNAAEAEDNIVEHFIPGGSTSADPDAGELVINNAKINDEIKVPVRTLTIDVTFPNVVFDQVKAYQDMTITISGGDLDAAIVKELGTDDVAMAADKYTVSADLTKNNTYNIKVEGAGYRTARYTVTMTDNKTVTFWNNVMDNDKAMEVNEVTNATKGATKINFLAGDIVKDNNINIYDLSAVVSYFATPNDTSDVCDYAKYDLNRDGVIDSKDVAYVLVSWNN